VAAIAIGTTIVVVVIVVVATAAAAVSATVTEHTAVVAVFVIVIVLIIGVVVVVVVVVVDHSPGQPRRAVPGRRHSPPHLDPPRNDVRVGVQAAAPALGALEVPSQAAV
jgi:hypothetical protein